MKMVYSIVKFLLYLSAFCIADAIICEERVNSSGTISYARFYDTEVRKCWVIQVPEGSYARVEIEEISSRGRACDREYLQITVAGTNDSYKFCSQDKDRKSITALNDVNITYHNWYAGNTGSYWTTYSPYWRTTNWYTRWPYLTTEKDKEYFFRLSFKIETGVTAIKGVNVSRESAIKWLKNHRLSSSGWGRNTHRAITALYLSAGASFRGKNLEENLMVKQLELQTAVALLRNSSVPLSVNDLSMYINALTVTCHNVRQFYGHDLLHILGERLPKWKSPSPGAYLTLCSANWTFSESHIRSLLDFLDQSSEYPFDLEIEAMAIMALTCVKNKTNAFRNMRNAAEIYNTTIKKFMALQQSDGSFGNVYTTALVTQSLLASGQEGSVEWNVTLAVKNLMMKLNSSSNFLSTSLALPIFNGKTLVDIPSAKCDISWKQGEDDEISDVIGKLGGKMKIKYSLYIDDSKDIVHSVYLRMPENSSAYDVMKVAQVADPKFKFLHTDASGYIYVYEIAEITNDPEAGKFWLLYSGYLGENGTLTHSSKSPDKLILRDGQQLVMWYKTAHVREAEASNMLHKLFLPATL